MHLLAFEETESLIALCQLLGEECDIKILHYHALKIHTGILRNLNGIKGLNFADLFECVVFDGIERCKRKYPHTFQKGAWKEKGLCKGKTVLIIPYSNTLHSPDMQFWEAVVRQVKLEHKESLVVTYVYQNEQPICGTESISSKLEELADLAEFCGMVIGIRCGLIDLLSTAICRKIILYPDKGAEEWIHGSIKEFWSVNEFGYCNDAEEHEFHVRLSNSMEGEK